MQAPTPSTPLLLVANQPATRLHSQLDFGGHSAAAKHRGREVARMHPDDAAARGIADGDIIRLFNARGACLAGVRVTDGHPRRRDPAADRRLVRSRRSRARRCRSACTAIPNVLTRDVGTSSLAQGCTGQLTTVEVERFNGNLPPIQAYDPPVASRSGVAVNRGS